jgi:putative methionine-R-sulfoxide reductase with GAF domain
VLPPPPPDAVSSAQIGTLYGLSDPALSELGLEEFLTELLVRVREVLSVDTVAILLYDEDAQQLVARAAKGIEEEVERGVRIPIGRGFSGRIAAERVAIFIADVDHADILNPILRQKGIHSLLGVPLIVEGDLIGVMHVGSLTPRVFGMKDLAVLQLAAARAAPGIERARLHSALEHEHYVAMVLQRSLLPKRLIDRLGVSAAARYLPAHDEVGGDWYDVFELPGGRFGVAIGDVVGHGLPAAALMGQVRTALHAYAIQDEARPGRSSSSTVSCRACSDARWPPRRTRSSIRRVAGWSWPARGIFRRSSPGAGAPGCSRSSPRHRSARSPTAPVRSTR